ncbi:hypothetical protein [Intrasporangium sp. YIM S08009]|uniref:hypothetical protein n=1 Tax=Intrasporangium zincisolvens TaxID=3080018 RepID=UPI002B061335|nr:hypothetical protein [Intrasporangium sp. YIM S08009]
MSVLVLVVLIGGALSLVAVIAGARTMSGDGLEPSREWRAVRVVWLAAVVVGAVVAGLLAGRLDLGRGTMLVPAVLGLFVVAGVGLAETVVRPSRPAGVRTASLAPRRLADYLPGHLVTAVVGVATVTVATLLLTTATASADDLGRAGRQVSAVCDSTGSAAGPYPGSFYSVPLGLVLLATGVAAVTALLVVVRRPRGFAPEEVGDDVLRLRSTTRVLAASGAAVAASHAGVAFFASTALLRMDCRSIWMAPVGWLLLASVPVAVVLLGWFVSRVVAGGKPVAAVELTPERQPR